MCVCVCVYIYIYVYLYMFTSAARKAHVHTGPVHSPGAADAAQWRGRRPATRATVAVGVPPRRRLLCVRIVGTTALVGRRPPPRYCLLHVNVVGPPRYCMLRGGEIGGVIAVRRWVHPPATADCRATPKLHCVSVGVRRSPCDRASTNPRSHRGERCAVAVEHGS